MASVLLTIGFWTFAVVFACAGWSNFKQDHDMTMPAWILAISLFVAPIIGWFTHG